MIHSSDYARDFADFLGVPHAFPFWKGRVALYAILRALGIGTGDEVIVPGYTCVMNVNPIFYVGAKPIYVDIEPDTFNIAPTALAAAITPQTRAIIAQHTYGYPAAIEDIQRLAAPRGIKVLEDCCLALGSTINGKLVGTFADAAYFSSQWSKPYTTGLGGMAVTSNADLANSIRNLISRELAQPSKSQTTQLRLQLAAYRTLIYPRTTALATRIFRRLSRMGLAVGSSNAAEYEPVMPAGFFQGMSNMQMSAGRKQLHHLNENIAHRRRLTALYDQLLSNADWPARRVPAQSNPVLVRYPVRVADKTRAISESARHGVEIGSWFESPLHPHETPLEVYQYKKGQCPIAEQACTEVINLPLHPRANEKTVERTVRFIQSIGPKAR